MSKPRKSLVGPRKYAYTVQSGRCFYCGMPMWECNPAEFAARHKLSLKQANFLKCTGEHLTAHIDGGNASRSNIVAACWYCNSRRHKTAKPRTPGRYKEHVRKRMAKDRWHPFTIHKI